MLKIEISIATNEDEIPEYYGYYDSVEEAKDALTEFHEEYESEEE